MDCPPDSDAGAGKPATGKTAKKRRKGPRKATKSHLENAALHYLARFASSSANLKRVLEARVDRSARHHGTDADEGRTWVADIIRRYEDVGLLDDAAYAEARARDLHRRGTPVKGIRFKLAQKGVGREDIERAVDALAEDAPAPDLTAAAALARRRRLGPYRNAEDRAERREKDLAALARAGFDYDTARRVIEADTPEDLATLADDA